MSRMDEFSQGFFFPKRPSFQTANFVNLTHATPPDLSQRNAPVVSNGRWNLNYQGVGFEERRRLPPQQPQPPPSFRAYYAPEFQNGNAHYNQVFQQANFPPLGYCPPPPQHHLHHTPKSSRVHQHVSPPRQVHPVAQVADFSNDVQQERETFKAHPNVTPNQQTTPDHHHNVNFYYEYPPLSAAGSVPRRKKNSPTQIPIQAINRSINANGSGNVSVQHHMTPQAPWTKVLKQDSPSAIVNVEPSERAVEVPEPVSENCSVRSVEQPPVSNETTEIQNIMMAMTTSFKNHAGNNNNGEDACKQQWGVEEQRNYTELNRKYYEDARGALNQFRQDFGNNEMDSRVLEGEMSLSGMHKCVGGPVYGRIMKEASMFEVDERVNVDNRPMINLVGPGEREYRLFDDATSGSDIIRTVYDVNVMDIFNPREICSRRLLPHSVAFWPVDLVVGNDKKNLNTIKRNMLRIKGQTSASNEQPISSIFDLTEGKQEQKQQNDGYPDINDVGLPSLARFINGEGVGINPMGFITFMGYNVHKLFKNLDRNGSICTTFAGPLADRNFSADPSQIETMCPIPEYCMPREVDDCDWDNAFKWKLFLIFRIYLVRG
ncbi:unnamed protein product [Orchesella dallaii]|uniref:Uncharacterized protein n=1 Tax=Orchesella dallaii TaxID=48710 RepID=A0ABP1Q6E5_9HEXA